MHVQGVPGPDRRPELRGFLPLHALLQIKQRRERMNRIMNEKIITQDNYQEEVLECGQPVLLDFWASWCGPCRMLAPVIAELAEEYAGRIKVGKVNVDEEPELADAFRVSSIPLVVLIQNGSVVAQSVGYRPKEQIESLIKNLGV
ncbi:MAG: thioredoxin [Clostridia bacterium]|nr:thioredoxin [Clostridia bacterium]MBQ4290783.1 thioredoxin [Clostridia bacterium]